MKLVWHIIAKDLRQDKWALLFWLALYGMHLTIGAAFLDVDGSDLEWVDQLRWANVLLTIFELDLDRAQRVMLEAHYEGHAYVRSLPYEDAKDRIYTAHTLARSSDYPLSFYMEPET